MLPNRRRSHTGEHQHTADLFAGRTGKQARGALERSGRAAGQIPRYRVLTGMTGDFNRVVPEYEAGNAGEFEARMQEYATPDLS